MKTKSLTFFAVILFATATFALAATNDLSSALQKGLFEEEANHNLDAAIAAYQSVATQFDKDRKLAATAIFRLGEVYRKQGKTNEANVQYERIVSDFADQTTLVDLSKIHVQKMEQSGTLIAANGSPVSSPEFAEITRIQIMIKDSPDLINARQGAGVLPLENAARKGWLRAAEFLLANGADINRKSGNETPLCLAVQAGHQAMVELLVKNKADLEIRDGFGGTALHIASERGFKALAEILLANKADVNARISSANGGDTPLHSAASAGHKAVAELLLANGANVNVKNANGKTPLFSAISSKNLEMVKFLIANNADVNANDNGGATPLFAAIDSKDVEMAKFMIGKKADVNAVSKNTLTPLLSAVFGSEPKLVELLLQNGANTEAKFKDANYKGWTPLHLAASKGRKELVEMLLKNGANPNSIDDTGLTPLHFTAGNGIQEIAELLLANKADPNIQTKSSETALGFAKRRNSPAREEMVALLLKYGANENFERVTRISTKRAGKENPVFIKGNQPLNRYTIIELIVGAQLPFPDLANVKIERLEDGGKKSQMIPVNVEDILKSGDCSKNLWLEWGDIIEVPELDHNVNEQWVGYSKQHAEAVQKCLEKNVSITIKGETTNSILRAHINLNSGQVTLPDTSLIGVVGRFLRASSDSNRIKVKRIDPVTKRSHEIVSDLEKAKGLRLIEGDQIEIPERDPNAPVPAANTGLPAIPPSAPSALITF